MFVDLLKKFLQMEREPAVFVDLLTRSIQMGGCCVCRLTDKVPTDGREPTVFLDLLTRFLQMGESLLCL